MIAKWPNAITAPLLVGFVFIEMVLFHNAIASSSSTTAAIGTKSGQLWPRTKCAMSEYTCTNGKCIQLNQYCDNVNDCGDSSDEPRFCTSKLKLNFTEISLLKISPKHHVDRIRIIIWNSRKSIFFYTFCGWFITVALVAIHLRLVRWCCFQCGRSNLLFPRGSVFKRLQRATITIKSSVIIWFPVVLLKM